MTSTQQEVVRIQAALRGNATRKGVAREKSRKSNAAQLIQGIQRRRSAASLSTDGVGRVLGGVGFQLRLHHFLHRHQPFHPLEQMPAWRHCNIGRSKICRWTYCRTLRCHAAIPLNVFPSTGTAFHAATYSTRVLISFGTRSTRVV